MINCIRSKIFRLFLSAIVILSILITILPNTQYKIATASPRNNHDASLYGNTDGNIQQGTTYTYRNGWLYSTVYDGSWLNRMKTDGSKRTELNINNATNLNVTDKYIFYLNSDENNKNNIFRTNLDGKKRIGLYKDGYVRQFIVYDKYIYYLNGSFNLYRMNLDGTGKKKLTNDKCKYFSVTKNYVIYSLSQNNSMIYHINHDGSKKFKILKVDVKFLITDSDTIYYSSLSYPKGIYKIKFNGTGNTKLCDDSIKSLNISGKILFYQNSNDMDKLYAINTDGTGRTKLLNVVANKPNIANGYLYYLPGKETGTHDIAKYRYKIVPLKIDNTPKTNTPGNSIDNINNSAFTAYDGKKIYYSSSNYIASADATSVNLTKKYFSNYNGYFELNASNGYIYYTRSKPTSSTNGGIYKVKSDFSNSPVELSNLKPANMTVIDNWIYFVNITPGSENDYNDVGSITKIKTDGTSLTVLNNKVKSARCLNIVGDYIYYIDGDANNKIYRMKKDGSNVTQLSTDTNVYTVHVYGNSIYYILENRNLKKMPINGGDSILLKDEARNTMAIYKDRIYFFDYNQSTQTTELVSCALNGTDMTVLANQVYEYDLNITAGYIYYYDEQYTLRRIRLPYSSAESLNQSIKIDG